MIPFEALRAAVAIPLLAGVIVLVVVASRARAEGGSSRDGAAPVVSAEQAEAADQSGADTAEVTLEPLVVEGRAGDLVGVARSGSEGAVGAEQLETRPILRNAELLEVIPGLLATQHSGSGKANQYFLRGFNLDHGSDFAVRIDGVPMNLPTHAHGQGYLDLNGVIPELVRTVRYNKGPYYAETGDFSSAGSAYLELVDRLERGVFKLEGGMYGFGRALLANSAPLAGGDLLFAGDFTYYEGPWQLDEDSLKGNTLLKWTRGSRMKGVQLFASAYAADWDATDQIPMRAIRETDPAKLRLRRRGFVDGTDGGDTSRYTAGASAWTSGDGWRTRAEAYGVYYSLDLFSNFTYFLEDLDEDGEPDDNDGDGVPDGDQIHQHDRRGIFGGDVTHEMFGEIAGFSHETRVGFTLRHDMIPEVALRRSTKRRLLFTVREDDVNETAMGVWADSTVQLLEKLRVVPGLRMDGYRFDVDAENPDNSGTEYDGIVSPKLAVVVGPWADTEGYFNVGGGYHSNDARGVTISEDPLSGQAVPDVDPLVRSWGYEVGVRTQAIEGFFSSVSLWLLDLDSELVFVGDAGATEAGPSSRRYGIEWSNYYEPGPKTALDFDVSWTHARFVESLAGASIAGDQDEIPGAIPLVISGGITQRFPWDLYAALRVRYLGDYPLIESGDEDAGSTTLVNLRLGWEMEPSGDASGDSRNGAGVSPNQKGDWAAYIDFLNLLDSHDRDIAYFYESRLPGEDEPVEDIHFHPVEPFGIRVAIERRF